MFFGAKKTLQTLKDVNNLPVACSGQVIFLSFHRRVSKAIYKLFTSFFQCLQGFLGSRKYPSIT